MRAPDYVIGPADDPYLERWWLIPRNRWLNVYLHHFLRSDDDRALHDHPWINVSILLRGSYLEHQEGCVRRRNPWRPWAPWRLIARLPTTAHRVELGPGPVWTLFLTGPRVRVWGFHCPHGWIPWTEFVEDRPGGNAVGKGCGG